MKYSNRLVELASKEEVVSVVARGDLVSVTFKKDYIESILENYNCFVPQEKSADAYNKTEEKFDYSIIFSNPVATNIYYLVQGFLISYGGQKDFAVNEIAMKFVVWYMVSNDETLDKFFAERPMLKLNLCLAIDEFGHLGLKFKDHNEFKKGIKDLCM